MSKELTTNNNLEMLQALRSTIALGLTDAEFQLFGEIVRATGLNPVTKEIWAIKAGGRLQIMTGINGFLRIANSHPQFDGMEVEHQFEGTTLLACTVKVYRKDRRFPATATAYMAEYSKPTPIWKQMPSVMLAKCAKSLAIREAFIQELGGLYTAEEMPSQYQQSAVITPNEDEELVISKKTGEVLGIKKKQPEVITEPTIEPVIEPIVEQKKAIPTYYSLKDLDPVARVAAEKYLGNCEAKQVGADVWRAPIRLSKLTQCITEDWSDAGDLEG